MVICVENISKKFQLGGSSAPYRTFRETVMEAFKGPFSKKKKQGEAFWALKDISFSINQGEAVAIIGDNGAGKSTLLKILSRIIDPTNGRAEICGRLSSLLEVGTGFHPELTGRENIFLNGSILGMRKSEIVKKFDEIVSFAEVSNFLDTPVKHYSSGMYVRLAFSVAAHLEPEILIVDEVLAVGDIRFQKKCLGKMDDVAKSGRTVLFVSHNMPAVRSLCQKAILLKSGQIEKIGAVDEVLTSYMSEFIKTGSEITWEEGKRPKSSSLELVSVAVLDANYKKSAQIPLSEAFFVQITFSVNNGATALFSLDLLTEDGTCVLNSLSNQEKALHGRPLKNGVHTVRCKIYPHLLNDGRYTISLTVSSAGWTDSFKVDKCISFEAVDDGILRGDYFGSFNGVVRPLLDWNAI